MYAPWKPHRLALPRLEKEHVTLAEEGLRPILIEDRPAVHLGCDPECDPARKVGLDEAGDHIHRGPLRREDQVQTHRAGLLRQSGQRRLDVGLHRHHEIGQLVHDDHDERHLAFRVLDRRRSLGRGVGGLGRHVGQRHLPGRRVPERLAVAELPVEVAQVSDAVGLQQLVEQYVTES